MNIVIDSNVLFAALIKDSTTRRLILEFDGFFLFPSYIFDEMEKHRSELLQKSGMTAKEFETLLQLILAKVLIVPAEAFKPHAKEALKIVGSIDPDDSAFFACALAYPGSVIWSDDKRLKKQSKIGVLHTVEIVDLMRR
ncbi:MAG TPA: PIN domain-containing protein [Candidatus Diapherotrites archaeon]|uniref:PIN domain-containing protein n=1 Tax=Candidatus Iainarchaeum sp. TaxID=3101447 RepID=A0A7J4JLS6_9ARCH|nr:PIN domain-containing protein [Candidatus Diapherotrites archaeon]HIH16847.1 PIN domain-containing protein [Candidatus Diapherotrites archaeon]